MKKHFVGAKLGDCHATDDGLDMSNVFRVTVGHRNVTDTTNPKKPRITGEDHRIVSQSPKNDNDVTMMIFQTLSEWRATMDLM